MNKLPSVVFNNCAGRNHVYEFNRPDAFFDLETYGRQANQATELAVGDRCIVAQKASKSDEIQFDTFLLEAIEFLPDKSRGETCRVFCGTRQRPKTLTRIDACHHPLYGRIFDRNTHFKRTSVVPVET